MIFQGSYSTPFSGFNEYSESYWSGWDYLLKQRQSILVFAELETFFLMQCQKRKILMLLCNYDFVSTANIKCYAIKVHKINWQEVLFLLNPDQYDLPSYCEF